MKQIDECLNRFFDNKSQLNRKWQVLGDDNILVLFHYQHTILIYDIVLNEILFKWYECPTDKRGLDAALEYLDNRK